MRFHYAAITIALLDTSSWSARAVDATELARLANPACAASQRQAAAVFPLPILQSTDGNTGTKKAAHNRSAATKAPPTGRKKSRVLPAILRDEMVRTIAFVCVDVVFKRGAMKVTRKEKLLKDLYYGTRTVALFQINVGGVSYMHQFCKGEGVFEHFWSPDGLEGDMVFNDKYSCSDVILRQDVDVSTSVLEINKFPLREIVSGRMLKDRAQDAQKKYKKASSCVEKYLDENNEPKKSGWDLNKVLSHVLDNMYELFQSNKNKGNDDTPAKKTQAAENTDTPPVSSACKLFKTPDPVLSAESTDLQLVANMGSTTSHLGTNVDSADSNDRNDPYDSDTSLCDVQLPTNKRPSQWFFPRFMAFASFYLFGENKSAGCVLTFMIADDPPKEDKKNLGCAAAKAEKANVENFE